MKIKRTIELQSGRGDVLTEQNKNDYILVVGSMFKAGELTDDPDLLLDGGLIGNSDITKAVVDSHGINGINAYTVPELVDVMCRAADVDMADLMKVLIKHSSFKDLSAALDIADPWQSNKTKENTPYTTAPKGMMSMVGEDDPVAEPEVSPYQYWNDEDVYGDNEIVMYSNRLWYCSMIKGKMCTTSGTFYVDDWTEIKEWVNSKHYKCNDHVLRHGCVYKRNGVTPKRSVNYAIFDDREWSKV